MSHPAIEAIVREEPEWNTVYFDEINRRINQVGHSSLGTDTPEYWVRQLEGGTDINRVELLNSTKPEEIDRGEALEIRRIVDGRWRRRKDLAERIGELHKAGILDEEENGGLFGIKIEYAQDLNGETDDLQFYGITVMPDGTVSLKLENVLKELKDRPISWHSYVLPTGTRQASHVIKFADNEEVKPEAVFVYDSSQITNYFLANLSTIIASIRRAEASSEASK